MTMYWLTPPQSPRPKCRIRYSLVLAPGAFLLPYLKVIIRAEILVEWGGYHRHGSLLFGFLIYIFLDGLKKLEDHRVNCIVLNEAYIFVNFFFYKPETYWITLLFMCIQVNPSLYDSLLEAWSFAIKAFLRVGTFRCRVVPTYWLAHGFSGEKIYEIN